MILAIIGMIIIGLLLLWGLFAFLLDLTKKIHYVMTYDSKNSSMWGYEDYVSYKVYIVLSLIVIGMVCIVLGASSIGH